MELPKLPDAAAQIALCFSYNGAPFAGFARQPGQHTVQGEIEQALSLVLRRDVEVVCAGRTDAGVHARAQVVSFPVSAEEAAHLNPRRLKRSLEALTDDAIAMQSLALMPPGFSARFSALSREYRYLVLPGDHHPLFLRDWCWDVRRELDVAAMNKAAECLVGEHDFKSFCLAASAQGKNTVRTLDELRVVPVNVMGEDALSIRVVGNAFLHSMVRSIVGTLVMVGAGRRDPEWVKTVLQARDRQAAGENAPAKGLVFWRVRYRGGIPCYEHDAIDSVDGGYAPAEEADALRAGAALADAVSDGAEAADAIVDTPLPVAVERAAARVHEGSMRMNDTGGKPAMPAAPRMARVRPADPMPAEGEASLCFNVPRDSAATRAAKAGKRKKSQAKETGGLFARLFGGRSGRGVNAEDSDDEDA